MSLRGALEAATTAFADAAPRADIQIGERREYGAGLGPHPEPAQLAALQTAANITETSIAHIETEVQYPSTSEQCDLVIGDADGQYQVEAKLLRFRRANGTPEPEAYAKVFSPLRPSGSLLTDAQKLVDSAFPSGYGLLGIAYDSGLDETPASIPVLADKVVVDLAYWFGIDASVVSIEYFDGLQHDVHESGAIVTWALESRGDASPTQESLRLFDI